MPCSLFVLYIMQFGPIHVTDLEPGTTKYWCACGLSKNQPWCDGMFVWACTEHVSLCFDPLRAFGCFGYLLFLLFRCKLRGLWRMFPITFVSLESTSTVTCWWGVDVLRVAQGHKLQAPCMDGAWRKDGCLPLCGKNANITVIVCVPSAHVTHLQLWMKILYFCAEVVFFSFWDSFLHTLVLYSSICSQFLVCWWQQHMHTCISFPLSSPFIHTPWILILPCMFPPWRHASASAPRTHLCVMGPTAISRRQ